MINTYNDKTNTNFKGNKILEDKNIIHKYF